MTVIQSEINELENYNTWTSIKKCDIPEKKTDDTMVKPKILLGT